MEANTGAVTNFHIILMGLLEAVQLVYKLWCFGRVEGIRKLQASVSSPDVGTDMTSYLAIIGPTEHCHVHIMSLFP